MSNEVSKKKINTRYEVFDLLRGLAALAVLFYHIGYMLGTYMPVMYKGYLAVDFFFILSGFVIAANYHISVKPRISSLDFFIVRLARLWPLFVTATIFGCVVVGSKLIRDFGYFDYTNILVSLGFNSLMMPTLLQSYGIDRLFLFNGASWSVFFEVLINIFFFLQLRVLSLKQLCYSAVPLCFCLIVVAWVNNGLDGGWAWENFHVGCARVLYEFIIGMIIFLIAQKINVILHKIVPAVLALFLVLSFFIHASWIVDCLVVVLLYPAIIFFGSKSTLHGHFKLLGCRLGDVSYSLYLLQTPMMLLTAGLCQAILGKKIAFFAPISGVFFISTLLFFSYFSWKYFELPSRNLIRSYYNTLKSTSNR